MANCRNVRPVYIARGDHKKKKSHIYGAASATQEDRWCVCKSSSSRVASWLEELERKPLALVPPNNPVVEEFDPLLARARIVEEDRGEWERWGQEGKGRNRVLLKRWFFTRDLENSIAPRMLDKIRQSVRTRHKLRLRWGILLRNTEDNRPLFWYTNVPASPWMNRLSESKAWLEALEESRLQGNVQRPDTKSVFDRAVSVDLKAILDRQPLRIGLGRLPAWLRNKKRGHLLGRLRGRALCFPLHSGPSRSS